MRIQKGLEVLFLTVEKHNNLHKNIIHYNYPQMTSMDNFFNYISKPINKEDIDVWFKMNNILPEKL